MANINVVNLGGEKVGEFELLDDVFAGEINDGLLWESVKHYRAALRQGTASTKTRGLVSGAGRSSGSRRAPAARVSASIRTPLWRGGGTVHGPKPRSYEYAFPQKKLMGALRSAIAAKIADGKFTIVDSFEVAEPKTKLFRTALNKLEAGKTTLLVESQPQARREALPRLAQSGRRRAGAQLRGSPLRPASLRARRLLEGRHRGAAGDAEEVCIEAQQAAQTQAAAEGGCVMPTLYTVIRRPLITEKGMGVKETQNTLVFEVDLQGHQDRSQAGCRDALQGQGHRCPHRDRRRQGTPPRQVHRLPPRLEEGLCSPQRRREDAGVPQQPVSRDFAATRDSETRTSCRANAASARKRNKRCRSNHFDRLPRRSASRRSWSTTT